MSGSREVWVEVTTSLVEGAIPFPDGSVIIYAEMVPRSSVLRFKVRHHSLPLIPDGEPVPTRRINIRKERLIAEFGEVVK